MKKTQNIAITLLFLLGTCFSARCMNNGGNAFEFLNINLSGRISGLNGAYAGMREDVNSVYSNPAGLAYLTEKEFILSNINWLGDISIQSLGYILPLEESTTINKNGSIGADISYLHMGEIPGYSIDSSGNPLGTGNLNVSWMLGILSYSRKFSGEVSAGASAKLFQENLAGVTASNLILDAGCTYETALRGKRVDFGAVIQNIGGEIKFIEKSYPAPKNIRIGASSRFVNDRLLLNADIIMPENSNLQLGLGAEYNLNNIVSLRAGYSTEDSQWLNLSLGMGVKVKSLSIDYAVVPYGSLGVTHRVSLTSRFSNPEEPVVKHVSSKPEIKKVENPVFIVEEKQFDSLKKIAAVIRNSTGCFVNITGYDGNYTLSLNKAKNVLNYFIGTEKLPLTIFEVAGSSVTAIKNQLIEITIRKK